MMRAAACSSGLALAVPISRVRVDLAISADDLPLKALGHLDSEGVFPTAVGPTITIILFFIVFPCKNRIFRYHIL